MSSTKQFFRAVDECNGEEIKSLSRSVTKDNLDSALCIVCGTGNIELVRVLLECGATNLHDAFPEAAYSGNAELVDLLISMTSDVDYDYALQTSCLAGNIPMFERILTLSKIVNLKPDFGMCLSQAAQGGHKGVVRYIADRYGATHQHYRNAVQTIRDDLCMMNVEAKGKAKEMIEWLEGEIEWLEERA